MSFNGVSKPGRFLLDHSEHIAPLGQERRCGQPSTNILPRWGMGGWSLQVGEILCGCPCVAHQVAVVVVTITEGLFMIGAYGIPEG
jgi:hypothetical protein